MGREFGLMKMQKEFFESFHGDYEAYYIYMEEHNWPEEYGTILANFCGRGTVQEEWFRDGLEYYGNQAILMRALCPEDIYNVIRVATACFRKYKLEPAISDRSFTYNEDEDTITCRKVDGFEYYNPDGFLTRLYNEDAEGHLFISTHYIDPWSFLRYPTFVTELLDAISNFDWDNYVLIYYISD